MIILDDAMTEQNRTANGTLVGNAQKFPSGLKAIADGFHSMGLKFGVYSSAGRFTCTSSIQTRLIPFTSEAVTNHACRWWLPRLAWTRN